MSSQIMRKLSSKQLLVLALAIGALVLAVEPAFAQDAAQATGSVIDKYRPEDITNFINDPVTPIAKSVRSNLLITSVLILPFLIIPHVILLMAIVKFSKKKSGGRAPATFHDNLTLEVAWTIIPAVVLILMAIPTFDLIRRIENPPKPDMNISITGYRFFWAYEYPDHDGITVVTPSDPLVIPTGKNVLATMTAQDVIHAWWVPAFGVKMDTVPGRLSQVWFNVDKPGWYKGQCAEICGAGHAKMLIDVVALPPDEFEMWLAEKNAEDAPAAEEADVAMLLEADSQ